MKPSLLRRMTELKRRAQLRRKTGLAKRNKARAAARFETDFGGAARLAFVRSLPCVVCGAMPTVAAHWKSRGAGGKAADTLPLCDAHHREQHAKGIRTFEKRHGVCLKDEAKRVDEEWERLETVH